MPPSTNMEQSAISLDDPNVITLTGVPCDLYYDENGYRQCRALDALKGMGCICGICDPPTDPPPPRHFRCPVNIEKLRRGQANVQYCT